MTPKGDHRAQRPETNAARGKGVGITLALLLIATVAISVGASGTGRAMICCGGGGGGGGTTQLYVTNVHVYPHSVTGTTAGITFQESPSVPPYAVTGSVSCNNGCQGGTASIVGGVYSIQVSGLVPGGVYSYQITVSAPSCGYCASGSASGSFQATGVAATESYDMWNPTASMTCGWPISHSYTLTMHTLDFASGDIVYNQNHAQNYTNTVSALDDQFGFYFNSVGVCWPYSFSVQSVSVEVELVDTTNHNDNFAWAGASSNLAVETSTNGQGQYQYSVGVSGGPGTGSMSLGLAYTAPTTASWSNTAGPSYLGSGAWEEGVLAVNFPSSGTNVVNVDWPVDINDQFALPYEWDHFEVEYLWSFTVGESGGLCNGGGSNWCSTWSGGSVDSVLGNNGYYTGSSENYDSQETFLEGGSPSGYIL
jgi:hypothetical protein